MIRTITQKETRRKSVAGDSPAHPQSFLALDCAVRGVPNIARALVQIVSTLIFSESLGLDLQNKQRGKGVTLDPQKPHDCCKQLQTKYLKMITTGQTIALELSESLTELLHQPERAFNSMKTVCESRHLDKQHGVWPRHFIDENSTKVYTTVWATEHKAIFPRAILIGVLAHAESTEALVPTIATTVESQALRNRPTRLGSTTS